MSRRHDRAVIDEVIADIAKALRRPPPPAHRTPGAETGLAGRSPGFALFYAYLDRLAPKKSWRDQGHRFVERALGDLSAQTKPAYSGGIAGLAWAIEHLEGWFVEADEDINDDVDALLLEIVRTTPGLTYDLQNGVAGFGLYAIERLPNPNGRVLLEEVVAWFDRAAVRREDKITWGIPPDWYMGPGARPTEPLFFPHVFGGVAGVVGVLGAAIHHGIAAETSRRLLEGALAWLWGFHRGGLFPGQMQLAWDRGSLGIAAVMFAAARAAGLPLWEERALGVARHLAHAGGPLARLRDPVLGSGVAGAAHVFYRLHLETQDRVFADAARTWLGRLLDRRRPGEGLAGFRTYSAAWNRRYLGDPRYPVGWIGLPGLLNGAAGIGLALLSVGCGQPPTWDRGLLLSY